jgi:hypothetical protein
MVNIKLGIYSYYVIHYKNNKIKIFEFQIAKVCSEDPAFRPGLVSKGFSGDPGRRVVEAAMIRISKIYF